MGHERDRRHATLIRKVHPADRATRTRLRTCGLVYGATHAGLARHVVTAFCEILPEVAGEELQRDEGHTDDGKHVQPLVPAARQQHNKRVTNASLTCSRCLSSLGALRHVSV